MRRSEFDRAIRDEFGGRGDSVVVDLVLSAYGRTPEEALRDGVPPKDIWLAVCAETDVPLERRHGAGRLQPKSR